jgi:predicted nucleic acid-binding protein
VVLDFMGNRLSVKAQKIVASIMNAEINLSVISKMELLGFTKVEQDLRDFVISANVIGIDEEVVDITIDMRRLYKIKLPDAIIAATAQCYGLTLVTADKDFEKLKGVVELVIVDL